MASESLVGGTTLDTYNHLSTETQATLNEVLKDTIGGVVTTQDVGGGTLITGSGSNGETQAVLISSDQIVVGNVSSGTLTLSVILPVGTGLALQGIDSASSSGATGYVTTVMDDYLPPTSTDAAVQEVRANLTTAIDLMQQHLSGSGATDVSVRIVTPTHEVNTSQTGTVHNDVVVEGSASGTNTELMAVLLAGVGVDNTLVLKNVQAAILLGAGTARVEDSRGAIVTGNMANQDITGSTGNDTLVGGGGSDTLTGGLGDNTFGLTSLQSHMVITDFRAGDHLGFNLAGITSEHDLSTLYTGLTWQGGDATLHFGDGMDITLVGVNPADLTLDMLQYSI